MTRERETEYHYECSQGHYVSSLDPRQVCPVYVKGCPCKGTLTRVGAGSRKGTK